MGINLAKVELTLGEVQRMTKETEDLQNRVKELEDVITQQRFTAAPGLDEVANAMKQARWVIGYGMGNLHYDDHKGWPWDKLLTFIAAYEKLPGLTIDDVEWVKDAKSFCEGAAERDEERRNRKPGDVPKPITK